jgi:hypothetical protein
MVVGPGYYVLHVMQSTALEHIVLHIAANVLVIFAGSG